MSDIYHEELKELLLKATEEGKAVYDLYCIMPKCGCRYYVKSPITFECDSCKHKAHNHIGRK